MSLEYFLMSPLTPLAECYKVSIEAQSVYHCATGVKRMINTTPPLSVLLVYVEPEVCCMICVCTKEGYTGLHIRSLSNVQK